MIFNTMKYLLGFGLLLLVSCKATINPDAIKEEITANLQEQQVCWNNGDLACFMEHYWHSDSLKFVTKNGIAYGWQKTFDNYKKSYPNKEAMGQLTFDIKEVKVLNDREALMVGEWHLETNSGPKGGYFSLLWAKTESQWVIILDHTS